MLGKYSNIRYRNNSMLTSSIFSIVERSISSCLSSHFSPDNNKLIANYSYNDKYEEKSEPKQEIIERSTSSKHLVMNVINTVGTELEIVNKMKRRESSRDLSLDDITPNSVIRALSPDNSRNVITAKDSKKTVNTILPPRPKRVKTENHKPNEKNIVIPKTYVTHFKPIFCSNIRCRRQICGDTFCINDRYFCTTSCRDMYYK